KSPRMMLLDSGFWGKPGSGMTENRPVPRISDLRHRLQLSLGMDLILRHDRRLGAEALDDGADIGPDRGARQQDRRFALAGGFLEGREHRPNEFLEAARHHGELDVVAFADQRLGEFLLPLRAHGHERQIALRSDMGGADLSRQPRADM